MRHAVRELATPGGVSVVAAVLGLALVVVAVAGSPLPWWAAVATAAVELLAVAWVVGRNAAPAVAAAPSRPHAVKSAA